MSASRVSLSRQWVPVAGGSCDVRLGYDALSEGSSLFKASVGKPRACMAVIPGRPNPVLGLMDAIENEAWRCRAEEKTAASAT